MPAYRFPTNIPWGHGYNPTDGYRHIEAASDEAALAHRQAKAAGTEACHLQKKDGLSFRLLTRTERDALGWTP